MCTVDDENSSVVSRVCHSYVCERLSVAEIARRTCLSRGEVTSILLDAHITVAPRGAGQRHGAGSSTAFGELLVELYVERGLSSAEIGDLLGMSGRAVRRRLAEHAIPRRRRGRPGLTGRAQLPGQDLTALYVEAGMSAEQVAARLGSTRGVVLRNAHDLNLPVRLGGSEPRGEPATIQLVTALYADPLVAAALRRHRVPVVPAERGRLHDRFPVPVPLTKDLLSDLYLECGVANTHIELLTGQPAVTVGRRLHRAGIPVRGRGGRCPFLRRWRAAL
ncbi:hypothetical protein K7472_31140 [Streptomyces sp. PTM05]|uniref:Uncharacterized protein n=1 Tax=Streptantibioticus parmotrematis TaxID=2873249 RepID=A0ABS7R1E4_9ACTN|nr:hypothetical protein [Streptantibioticus parmotrematis]MBY8889265.1 hypothetical protein [Streptantibioticus parmotrematis]